MQINKSSRQIHRLRKNRVYILAETQTRQIEMKTLLIMNSTGPRVSGLS